MRYSTTLGVSLALVAGLAQAAPLTITTYLEPGATSTSFWDVNNAGVVAGYSVVNDVSRAFTWTQGGGYVTLGGPAGAVSGNASGISDVGTVVGSWDVGGGFLQGYVYNGATYSAVPAIAGAENVYLRGISPNGQYITGYFSMAGVAGQGFVLDTSTSVFSYIGAGGNDLTIPQGVDDNGLVVGSDVIRDDVSGNTVGRPGFTFDTMTSTRTDIDLAGRVRTALRAIDQNGVISGWAYDGTGLSQGFTGGTAAPEYFGAPGFGENYVEGNNDAGWLVGSVYVTSVSEGPSRGMLAIPVSEPAAFPLAMLALMGAGLAGRRRSR